LNKVYRHKSLRSDEYLGHIELDGQVYEEHFGPDRYIGRVDLEDGRIFESRLGPDKYIGRVDLTNGKVYQTRIGPDEYLGKVRKNGHCNMHRSFGRDIYLGKIREMGSYAHGGAGFLLLLYPAMEEVQDQKERQNTTTAQQAAQDPGIAPSDPAS
jgi:hypothetical protein